MSFGGGGGGGGGFAFGTNNNQNSGFPGFGTNNNNSAGFGSTSNTGFGSSTATANPFGGSTFGQSSNTGAFGSSTNNSGSLFGNKPAASSLFTSNPSNTPSNLFGNTNNANTTSGGFGSGGFASNNSTNTNAFGSGTSTFGGGFNTQNKPAFGSGSSSTPLFGQGGAGTTSGFSSSSGSGAFGSGGNGTALNAQGVGPSDGSINPQFAPVTEKSTTGPSENFYSITMMPAYSKYSFEELRLADYSAGRRWGNGQTQGAGAFGQSTFGGFGSTNSTGGFGSSTANNPFNSGNTSASGGFGNNTSTTFGSGGAGLFGGKPAATGGSLFGQQSSGTTTGGLFGTSNTNATSNPFGTSSLGSNNNGSGGGLFGNNSNNNNQSKPTLFTNTSTSTPSAAFNFGSTSTTNNNGGGLFGNNNTPQQQSGGLFGNNTSNQPKPGLFNNSTGGAFGASNTQSQPSGGLFGTSTTSNTGGGLFGNNANTNTGGGLFGSNSNNQQPQSGGLFGNNSNNNNNPSKPSGLFGNSTFGSNQQSTTGGLFGNTSTNNQQSSGGLFSNTGNNNPGSFGFGNNNQNKPGTSLYGNTSTNQSGGLFGSANNNSGGLFGNSASGQQQNQQQQEQFKHSSLLDPNPYGQSSIWTGLPQPNMENSKPLVTPLVATQKLKESQAKPPPSLRLNQSRYMTPPRRNGFGFSYSTYGTPNSAASTPGGNGLSNSMYGSRFTGGSFGRSMGKAASVSSLRTQYLDGESVLSPGAFAPSSSRYSSGSIRRLTIDKSIRNDLFTRPPLPALLGAQPIPNGASTVQTPSVGSRPEPPPETTSKLKKRVSFEKEVSNGLNEESGTLVRIEDDEDDVTIDDPRSSRALNGAHTGESSRGKELAVVPEDRESDSVFSKKKPDAAAKPDPKPGDYWMKPTRAELGKMPRDKLQQFTNFEVGRVGCGKVVFNKPVDLTALPLDDLYENIIEIRLRAVTVYPDASSKPQKGKGLNVPSTISIENSWPRSRGQVSSVTSGPVFEKHVARLKRIHGTNFVSYEPETGIWTFQVPHYTRYGLDYDDEDDDADFEDSQLSAPPDTIQDLKSTEASVMEVDSDGYDSSGQDDTFALQKQKTVPGGFGRQAVIDEDLGQDVILPHDEPDAGSDRSYVSEDDMSDEDMGMAGSYPDPTGPLLNFDKPTKPILRPGQVVGTPGKALLDLEGDWAEQLQRTISPRKQNRDALREAQSKVLLDRAYEPIKPTSRKNEFRSSIDVMNAIFGNEGNSRGGHEQAEPDFEFPYAKRAKTLDQSACDMNDEEKAWHTSFKPNFTGRNQLVCKSITSPADGEWDVNVLAKSNDRVVSISSLKQQEIPNLVKLLTHAEVKLVEDVPKIEYTTLPFSALKKELPGAQLHGQEGALHELLHVLFDTYEDDFNCGLTQQQRQDLKHRIRKARLGQFLSTQVAPLTYPLMNVADAAGAAFRHLTAHNVQAACDTLMKAKNFNLAMMVAQIEAADGTFQQDMSGQITAWKEQNIISEMTEEIRSLYELLSGNTTICQGKQTGPAEDRATTFLLSEKYELSWLQSFALCLWYGTAKNGNIEDVVEDFANKVSAGEETASPVFADGNEDPMWVILKLYASWKKVKAAPVPTFPQALSALSKPWDVSSTFRLFQAICRGLQDVQPRIDHEKADQLAADYAFQLEARGSYVAAIYALAHLRHSSKRGEMMLDLLCRHAKVLPWAPSGPETVQSQWEVLTQVWKIPENWIFQAKALHCRSCNDSHGELRYLLQAEEWEEAHECLCRRVAPKLVINEDYDLLRDVTTAFGDDASEKIEGWEQGGQVHEDFAAVLGGGESVPSRRAALTRLQSSLTDIGASFSGRGTQLDAGGLEALQERVAVKEMGRTVAELLEEDGMDSQDILELPLTREVKSGLVGRMSVDYYRKVMGGGR